MSAHKNVQVLIATGDLVSLEQWQGMYKLPVGSDKIGKYFSLNEDRFQRDLSEFGVLIVNAPLMMVMDEARRLYGKPMKCSSYNRTEAKQQDLIKQEEEERLASADREKELSELIAKEKNKLLKEQYQKELATLQQKLRAGISPHVAKMAVDLDFLTREEVATVLPFIQKAAKNMNIRIRVGYKQYLAKSIQVERGGGAKNSWTFIHVDVCPEFYAVGMPFHNQPHPPVWELQNEW